MTDPARAERLWLAIAVATLWLVQVGGADESAEPAEVPELSLLGVDESRRPRWRMVSVFARGWVVIVVTLLNHGRLPLGRLLPEPWPAIPLFPEPIEAQSQSLKVA